MTKYKAKKKVVNGITFDSKVEADYYEYLLKLKTKGYVTEIKVHPKYLLVDKFQKFNKKYRAMHYIGDFEVTFNSGETVVIDIKGLPTETAKLKRKLFDWKYPDIKLFWIKRKGKRWLNVR